jgi:hypothetical protein
MEQDTGKYRTNTKDQFYTSEHVARECIESILSIVPETSEYLWIEPSAGNGAFLHNIPNTFNKIGIDLDPKSPEIISHDYLTWEPNTDKNTIVFGNPPFGRQSCLAKAFIHKSCKFADIVAFILPKSFSKPSMYNAFDLRFHCIHSVELAKDSFVLNNSKYDVPCVFQIWQKQDSVRMLEKKINSIGFRYVKATDPHDIVFRRVGALAGKCYKNDGSKYSIQSHHFLDFENKAILDSIIEKINNHIFPSNTVGPRSLSKTEINSVINSIIASS